MSVLSLNTGLRHRKKVTDSTYQDITGQIKDGHKFKCLEDLSKLVQKFDDLAPATKFISTKPEEPVKVRYTKDEKEHIAPITLMTVWKRSLECFPDHKALAYQTTKDGPWNFHTFRQYYDLCTKAAKSFIKCGLKPLCGVGILGFNSCEWFISYVGCIFAGGLATGIYSTNGPDACYYVLQNARCNVCVVENNIQLQKILSVWSKLPELKAIIQYRGPIQTPTSNVYTWDDFINLGKNLPDADLQKRWEIQAPNKCSILIYTSGTTGDPKGVMLTHDNLIYNATVCARQANLGPCSDILISYLPLSHVAAQILDIYIPIISGATIYFAQPDALKGTLNDTMKDAKPTVFLGVPRVWEKMQEKIMMVEKTKGFVSMAIINFAKYIGYWGNISLMNGGSVPYGWTLANILVFSKIRKALGLERCHLCLTAAAPIMKDTLDFFMSLNLPIMELFGMSESSGPHTISFPWRYRTVSAGMELYGFQTKILKESESDENGEICLGGRNLFMGYLNMPEKTKETFTEDEVWLKSGDIGKKDKDGFLFITGRIKELIITAGGENIAPIPIEDAIKESLSCISNCMLVGDKKKFLAMLITLKTLVDPVSLAPLDKLHPLTLEWCRKIGLPSHIKTLGELLGKIDPKVTESIQEIIDKVNEKAISKAQIIQKWSILPRDFSLIFGELGPTLKLRRMIVSDMYKSTIDAFYANTD